MALEPGDHVLVELLGKGVVREVRRGGRYLVEIKGRSLLVTGQQLSPLDNRKTPRANRARETPDPKPDPHRTTRSHAPASLDLHGMTSEDAVAALDAFLNDAILAGLDEVRVIHGRSGGRLKSAVHARLKTIGVLRAFRVDPRNPGVTIVSF
jgi:dsDNA-specific endonuclease/ATPase MutS2